MLKVLNTDRCLDNFVENNFIVNRNDKPYQCIGSFVGGKGCLDYSPSSTLELTIENSMGYRKDVKLNLFHVTIEFPETSKFKKYSSFDKTNHIQYFVLKVKDIIDLYLFNHNTEELKDDFERHEITFLRHISEIETNKTNNLICMFNYNSCRIIDTDPKEKYNQTNFGNRYVLFGNPREIVSSLRFENSKFSFRDYLSNLLNVDTVQIKNLLSIFFLRRIYQKDDEIVHFDYPLSLLEILETYGKDLDSPWYHKFKRIRPSENTDMVVLSDVRKLESDKFCYAPLNEWSSYHLTKIDMSKDINLILGRIERKFQEMKMDVKSEIDYLSIPGGGYGSYDPKGRSRTIKKREFELDIKDQMDAYEFIDADKVS
jgi:hypothetical protein